MAVQQWFGLRCKGYARYATAFGLRLCFTAVGSPEPNGISETFVKTFKRDYARLSILPEAETVIALLPARFEDNDEVRRPSGVKFSLHENFFASVLMKPRELSGSHTPWCLIDLRCSMQSFGANICRWHKLIPRN
jgi:transposase InsO family protein